MLLHGGMTEGGKQQELIRGMHSGEFGGCYEFAPPGSNDIHFTAYPLRPPSGATSPSAQTAEGEAWVLSHRP